MPLNDFACRACGEQFEAFTSAGGRAPCPACGADDVERRFGGFAGPFTVGLRGAAARRSDAQRRVREEQRRERREQRRHPEGK
jgi:putative FmdB family regulatory protein